MHNLSLIEEYYKKYIKSLYYWIPEGIYAVDLNLLEHFGLLHFQYPENQDPLLTRYFNIVESPDKITLLNDEFVIWIMADKIDHLPVTFTLIALNKDNHPQLEAAFIASGVYNSSKLVLKILEKFLMEIQENEQMIHKLEISS